MSIEDDIYTRLSGIAGGRVAPVVSDQGTPLPRVTYTFVSAAPEVALNGANKLHNATVQLDCWDSTMAGARALLRSVQAAMTPDGADFRVGDVRHNPEQWEADTGIYRASADFSLWYTEA